jgi:acyl dehydratase
VSLEHITGRTYGPFVFELSAAKVAEYVAATGGQADRWTEYAPPSYAGAALFKVAPAFLFDPDVAPLARLLIHGEQTFSWPEPWRIGSTLTATGSADRMRERGGVTFATFSMRVDDEDGRRVLDARSVFLMSADTLPGGEAAERAEPLPGDRAQSDNATISPLPDVGDSFPTLNKSASRADLVRYAAASEDFNPMHWDHDRANQSGVGGVICHGLLMSAWSMQLAVATSERPDPLADAKIRFRLPLYPNQAATVGALVVSHDAGLASVKSQVLSDAGEHVATTMTLRTGTK